MPYQLLLTYFGWKVDKHHRALTIGGVCINANPALFFFCPQNFSLSHTLRVFCTFSYTLTVTHRTFSFKFIYMYIHIHIIYKFVCVFEQNPQKLLSVISDVLSLFSLNKSQRIWFYLHRNSFFFFLLLYRRNVERIQKRLELMI